MGQDDIEPGQLVVKRLRWNADAGLLGLVIGEENGSWLVMWTLEDQRIKFKWHLANALLSVDKSSVEELKRRGKLRP